MKYFVTFKVFDTMTKKDEIMEMRKNIGPQIKKLKESGKMHDGAIFADVRGGYFILDVQSGTEVLDLLGEVILDHCHVETHPLLSFEELHAFFEKEAVAAQV